MTDDHIDHTPTSTPISTNAEAESLTQRLKDIGKGVLPFVFVALGGLGYYYIPLFADGTDWVIGMVLLGLTWLWANGYAMPILVGVLVYLTDAIVGVRLRTWSRNMGYVRRLDGRVRNLGYGFLHRHVSVNDFVAAAVIGVAYMFIKLTWFNGASDAPAASPLAVLTNWRAHLELLEVSGGVLLGIWVAPWLGSFLRRFRLAATFGDHYKYDNLPVISSIIRGLSRVYQRLYQWGHLDNILSDAEVDANRKAIGIKPVFVYPVAFCLNTIRGTLRFLFAPGHAIFGVGLRWFVWAFVVALPFMPELWAPVLLAVVNYSMYVPIMFFSLGVLWLFYRGFRWLGNKVNDKWVGELIGVAVASILAIFMMKAADEFDYYSHLWNQHQTLKIVEVTKDHLPVAEDSRLYALGVIRDGMNAKLEYGVTIASEPAYVRIGDEVRWTAQIEKLHWKERWFRPTSELFSLPATQTVPTFGQSDGQRLDDEYFDTSMYGHFGRNVMTSAYRSLPWSKLATHAPYEMRLMQNDDGDWVQVISLDRYAGIPLRRKLFGGVVVIPQHDKVKQIWLQGTWVGHFWPAFAKSIDEAIPPEVFIELFGLGTYISPEQIEAGQYPYLQGNNLLAQVTARRIAESFRFHRDVLAPFSQTRTGDVRIPDQVEDRNNMPHFGLWKGLPGQPKAAVYGNIILQPFGKSNSMAYELWIPGDGSTVDDEPIVYMFDAIAEGQGEIYGVTGIIGQAKEILPDFDWEQFKVQEVTSYYRELGGQVRPLRLARLVSSEDDGARVFSGAPKIIVYDPVKNQALLLKNPNGSAEAWDQEILQAFGTKWEVAVN